MNDPAPLLDLAARELRHELLPQLSGEARYRAAMAVRAMEIALRSLREGNALAERERQALAALYGAEAATEELAALRRRLAHDIRRGRFDEPEARRRLEAALNVRVACRLALSWPGYR